MTQDIRWLDSELPPIPTRGMGVLIGTAGERRLGSPRSDVERALRHPEAYKLSIGLQSETRSFSIAPKLDATFGVVSAIRVQDIIAQKWFNWDRPGPFTPSEPVVTPGSGNLYIAAWAVNQGQEGHIKITMKDDAGATLASKTISVPYSEGVGIEYTGDMPGRSYGITISVTP